MDIPVLLEPTATGWRATTGGPFNLTAEGPTKDDVLAALRKQIVMTYVSGTRVVSLTVPEPHPALDALQRLGKNPFLEEWAEGVREHRAEVNVPPEPEDELSRFPIPGSDPAGQVSPPPDQVEHAR